MRKEKEMSDTMKFMLDEWNKLAYLQLLATGHLYANSFRPLEEKTLDIRV
jgi:hypothetical protein